MVTKKITIRELRNATQRKEEIRKVSNRPFMTWWNAAALTFCVMLLGNPLLARADHSANFAADAIIPVRLNWSTFVASGFPDDWQDEVVDALKSAIQRWRTVAGARLYPTYGSITYGTTPSPGEILVSANEAHIAPENRLASGFGNGHLVFHRKGAIGGTSHNWVPFYSPGAGTVDFEAVAVHELGHVLGYLDDHPPSRRTMRGDYTWPDLRFGPLSNDVNALRNLYGTSYAVGIQTARRFDQPANPSAHSPMTINGCGVISTSTAVAGLIRPGQRLFMVTTNPAKQPMFRWASFSSNTLTCDPGWTFYGGERSFYGMAAAQGSPGAMWAWVDHANDDMVVKVLFSPDPATTGFGLTSATGSTIGTPGLAYLGGTAWALAYARRDWANPANSADVVLRTTTNNGASWGSEFNVSAPFSLMKAEMDVSIARHTQMAGSTSAIISYKMAPQIMNDTSRIATFRVDINTTTGAASVVSIDFPVVPNAVGLSPPSMANNMSGQIVRAYPSRAIAGGYAHADSTSTFVFSSATNSFFSNPQIQFANVIDDDATQNGILLIVR